MLTEDGFAIESKVGRTYASLSTLQQVRKDAEILNDPNSGVNSIAWEFRISPQTGKVGPSPRLKTELEAAGIEIRVIE